MAARPHDPPVRRVRWTHAFRIIPTRYPPVPLFERLGGPAEWETLAEIESLTNPRVRDELGEIRAVPAEQRHSGPGASYVMAPFVHARPSRFADGSYGVYSCAQSRATSVRETAWHLGRFYAATAEGALEVQVQVLAGAVDDRFHDLRGSGGRWTRVLDPADYTASQELGRRLRAGGSRGIVYPSVRHRGGTCLGAFTPRAVGIPEPQGVLCYRWDGVRIDRMFDYETGAWEAL